MTLKRIHILGVCGSGKTVLSEKISKKLHIKKYDLDEYRTRKNRR